MIRTSSEAHNVAVVHWRGAHAGEFESSLQDMLDISRSRPPRQGMSPPATQMWARCLPWQMTHMPTDPSAAKRI